MNDPIQASSSDLTSCCATGTTGNCRSRLPRRDMLKLGGSLAAGVLLSGQLPVMAGPFTKQDFDQLVPRDKKLSPSWVKSLFARGEATVYSGDELKYIGLAVGGVCCGHLYLGGDGKLWHWDIFNQYLRTGSDHYQHPLVPQSPIDQGFAIATEMEGQRQVRTLDRSGFSDIRFRGQYPLGLVDYRDPSSPVTVALEAFPPFIPLDTDSSSLPATVMRYTVKNVSERSVMCSLAGWMPNAAGLFTGEPDEGVRRNRLLREADLTLLECQLEPMEPRRPVALREDILFDDFESESYANWIAEGTAFGAGPVQAAKMPAYQGDVGAHGKRLVNSHNTRSGEDVVAGDRHLGTLTSKPFIIQRNYIHFLMGGGPHQGRTCLNLLIDGKVVKTAAGRSSNRLRPEAFHVAAWQGKQARLQIVDQVDGPWGNVGVDYIRFSDKPLQSKVPLTRRQDYGTLSLAVLAGGQAALAAAALPKGRPADVLFDGAQLASADGDSAPLGDQLTGAVGQRFQLEPGAEQTVSFVIAWRFENLPMDSRLQSGGGRYYATRFDSAASVTRYLAQHFDQLYRQTRLWHASWYDSTLPHWFLERTFINTSTLATSTCHRFADGRFWGWEGVGCCHGTCSHVWQYAQAVGRIFPELERITREHVDFGLAFHADSGSIDYRGEFARHAAIDGQCGTILRACREHQMSADDALLRRIWPKVKKSIEFLIRLDGDANGILEGEQYNTLDSAWYGPISWISSLYVAALRAGEEMAREMNDVPFAKTCGALARRGGQQIVKQLYNGEFFFQRRDPRHPEAFGAGIGCHIDQVFGQSWAHQLGLGRILPEEETRSALRSLWKYNFTPDVGPYRKVFQPGRWYAMPGEAGLIMCTFPNGGAREAGGANPKHGFVGYLNECMNGFEYQAASHMIAEGLLQEGLAVIRAIHDRYHASRRNPYNEIECGDHYARSLASYGAYLAICGYQYHGPKGHIGFAPRLHPEDFRAAFTAAEGWGVFRQQRSGAGQLASLELKWGKLRLRTIALGLAEDTRPGQLSVMLNDRPVTASLRADAGQALITLHNEVVVQTGQTLSVSLMP